MISKTMKPQQLQELQNSLYKKLTDISTSIKPLVNPVQITPPNDSFDVILKEAGGQKLELVKLVKELTNLGLKEAKDLVDAAPKRLIEGVGAKEAGVMKYNLEELGAVVEIKSVFKESQTPAIEVLQNAIEYFQVLKKRVENKKLKSAQRIYKDELLVALEYFQDLEQGEKEHTSGTNMSIMNWEAGFRQKWNQNCRFDTFIDWFNPEVIEQLLLLFNKEQEIGTSLIPIKGISKVMQAKLRTLSIYDVGGLLTKGSTQKKRDSLAISLHVDIKLVNSWVKQADLWRVEGMTTDTAYLLVQIGIRNPKDLSKVDINKAYPIMERLVLSQPDFHLMEEAHFKELIKKAGEIEGASFIDQSEFARSLAEKIASNDGKELNTKDIAEIIAQSKRNSGTSRYPETPEEEPYYLFSLDNITIPRKSGTVIREGLEFLNNVPLVLPLPYAICGQIKWKMSDNETDTKVSAYPDALVDISGISSSSTDKTETERNPSAYTASDGGYKVVLPEKLNLQEGIIITVSQGIWKQKFLKSASDIINAVPQQKTLDMFNDLQATLDLLILEDTKETRFGMLLSDLYVNNGDIKKIKDIAANQNRDLTNEEREKMADLIEEKSRAERDILNLGGQKVTIKEEGNEIVTFEYNPQMTRKDSNGNLISDKKYLEDKYEEIKAAIISAYNNDPKNTKPYSSNLETILKYLVSSDNRYEAELGESILINDIFKGYNLGMERALPSVKLMGNDEKAIHLPTDTAPSRVFNYVMLQRLVEPELGPAGEMRKKLASPVDVMKFKENIYTNPDILPQMSSLGIGYILDMHQAWVPDGFALGSLLYSLVLAPGEEQRLIVRENKQSYTVSDDIEGTDMDNQSYQLSQTDDSQAAYDYALNQMSNAESGYDYRAETKSSGRAFGGGFGGVIKSIFTLGGAIGSSGAKSVSKGHGSTSASQSNAHHEASTAAQKFQHNIKSGAARISQSKRISVRTATSEETNAVATKIIANHNHSHAMTIQYWEVMRRFRLETCIDGVELVLFVPLKLIKFIGGDGKYSIPDISKFTRDSFNSRYNVLLKYVDNLLYNLPYKYRTGLNLIKRYAEYPSWSIDSNEFSTKILTMNFKCNMLSFDDITATIILKEGKGKVAGSLTLSGPRKELGTKIETSLDLKQAITRERNNKGVKNHTFTFTLPSGVVEEDIAYIRIDHACESFNYTLFQNPAAQAASGRDATEEYKHMMDKYWDSMKDNTNTLGDQRKIEYFKNILPEAWLSPNVLLTPATLKTLGDPIISDLSVSINVITEAAASSASNVKQLTAMQPGSTINSSMQISISSKTKTLRYSELQEMESTLHHIASDTLHYSQIIWASLSADERAMMLEQYTIDMDFGDEIPGDAYEKDNINIPLLNCVNIQKMLGFYGNCILLPFTYPQQLAKKLKKTSAELQDALYRYHTHCFRVPTTTVSLPTDGMIGEAVLGETNVSEVIDLTRFWNWKDSPIDKMEIDASYLNNTDYLANKEAGTISALNLQGATAATPVTVPDLISALVAKQTPKFENITGLDQLKDVLNNATTSAANGRDKVLDNSKAMAQLAVDAMKIASSTAAADPKKNENALPEGVKDKEYPGHDFKDEKAELVKSEKSKLPNGLEIKEGKLSGTPTEAGTFTLTIKSGEEPKNYSLTIKEKEENKPKSQKPNQLQ